MKHVRPPTWETRSLISNAVQPNGRLTSLALKASLEEITFFWLAMGRILTLSFLTNTDQLERAAAAEEMFLKLTTAYCYKPAGFNLTEVTTPKMPRADLMSLDEVLKDISCSATDKEGEETEVTPEDHAILRVVKKTSSPIATLVAPFRHS
ncbi:hypothetical protein G9A89_008189 [Geosiphon pyriformis]|nr:hypothetical protein G9A89_008189 [Geosiphon pyriformis]